MKTAMVLLFFSALACYAQTEKGSEVIGGDISARYSAYEGESLGDTYNVNHRSISLSPHIAYFVRDNLAIGLAVDAVYLRSKDSYSSINRIHIQKTIGVGPFMRKYFSLGDKIATFGQASTRIRIGTEEDRSTNLRKGNLIGLYCALNIGVAYFLTPKWGLEASYGTLYYYYDRTNYGKDSNGYPQKTTQSILATSFSISSLYFGMQYYF